LDARLTERTERDTGLFNTVLRIELRVRIKLRGVLEVIAGPRVA
jgi:hypothetical protein